MLYVFDQPIVASVMNYTSVCLLLHDYKLCVTLPLQSDGFISVSSLTVSAPASCVLAMHSTVGQLSSQRLGVIQPAFYPAIFPQPSDHRDYKITSSVMASSHIP